MGAFLRIPLHNHLQLASSENYKWGRRVAAQGRSPSDFSFFLCLPLFLSNGFSNEKTFFIVQLAIK